MLLYEQDTLEVEETLCAAFERARFPRTKTFARELKARAIRAGITYEDDRGRPIFMNYGLLPVAIPERIIRYLAVCADEIQGGIRRILPLWFEDRKLRRVLPLWPEEEAFLRAVWAPACWRAQPMVGRLDTSLRVAGAGPRPAASFYEWNGSCVGGMHYSPAGEALLEAMLLRRLRAPWRRSRLFRQTDLRDLVLGELRAHQRKLGDAKGLLVHLEDRQTRGGITEYPSMVRTFARMGVNATMADPRDLDLLRGQVLLFGQAVSVIFRNVEMRDIVQMERRHGPLEALREAWRQNRVVSSHAGDFDHKSLWEVFQSRRYWRLFTARQRKIFRRHLPWTRLLGERRTELPDGVTGDLVRYARRNRETLVIKPNRSCGGEGVVLGAWATQPRWERALERALADRSGEGWVVQRYVTGYQKRLPILDRRRGVILEPLFVNYGVIAAGGGYGVIGRVCREPIVNVSRGGAEMGIFYC